MTNQELVEILLGLPPEMEVIFKTSTGLQPLNFSFSDIVDIVTVELEPGDTESFIMISEEESEPELDILKFMN